MAKIVENVEFDTVAREWRMKWSTDDEKKSLVSAQQVLMTYAPVLKSLPGVKGVQRIVCGGCQDFKVIVSLDASKFGEWEATGFAPETEFLAAVTAIAGVSQVETQTYTIMPV